MAVLWFDNYPMLLLYWSEPNIVVEFAEGKNDKAVEALDFAMEKMPVEKFGYNYFVFGIIDAYYKGRGRTRCL